MILPPCNTTCSWRDRIHGLWRSGLLHHGGLAERRRLGRLQKLTNQMKFVCNNNFLTTRVGKLQSIYCRAISQIANIGKMLVKLFDIHMITWIWIYIYIERERLCIIQTTLGWIFITESPVACCWLRKVRKHHLNWGDNSGWVNDKNSQSWNKSQNGGLLPIHPSLWWGLVP